GRKTTNATSGTIIAQSKNPNGSRTADASSQTCVIATKVVNSESSKVTAQRRGAQNDRPASYTMRCSRRRRGPRKLRGQARIRRVTRQLKASGSAIRAEAMTASSGVEG